MIWHFLAVLGILFPSSWELLQGDVSLQTLESFLKLNGKLVEDGVEFFLLVFFADAPSGVIKSVHKWLVNLVDDRVE